MCNNTHNMFNNKNKLHNFLFCIYKEITKYPYLARFKNSYYLLHAMKNLQNFNKYVLVFFYNF